MRDEAGTVPASAASGLTVSAVEGWEAFAALRPDWQALEARDPDGTVFLSWDWLARAFRSNPGRWRVFAVHRGRDLVCVLPLKYRVHWSRTRQVFETEIEAGGRLLWSEYTGFLCDPAHEVGAVAAIARHLRGMPWARLSIRYEATGRRARLFLDQFSPDGWSAGLRDYRINGGATDNLSCPQVPLPGDYETYLSQRLGKNTRRNFRRFMERRIDGGELRVTVARADSIDRDLRVLLDIWHRRWVAQKGAGLAGRVAASYEMVMRAALDLGLLYLPVLWQDDRPLGALGHVLDPRHRRVHCVVSCRDGDAPVRNAGFMLHAHSIRWAIANGYRLYDFSHGDEAYKFDFGADVRRVAYLDIRPRGETAFDPICRTEAMRRVIRFIDKGQSAEAAAGCRQLLPLID